MKPFSPPLASFSASDEPEIAPVAEPAETIPESHPDAVPQLPQLRVFKTLSEPTRLRMIELLSGGDKFSASQLAKILGKDLRRISDHVRILRRCGLVNEQVSTDRRISLIGIKPEFLSSVPDGLHVVDFGSGVIRFPIRRSYSI